MDCYSVCWGWQREGETPYNRRLIIHHQESFVEKVIRSLIAAAAILGASSALACDYPGEADFVMPNGTTASKEVMIETQGNVKRYVAAVEGYLSCLDEKQSKAGDELTDEQQAIHSLRYNAAVDAMETVADQFNAALGDYKNAQ